MAFFDPVRAHEIQAELSPSIQDAAKQLMRISSNFNSLLAFPDRSYSSDDRLEGRDGYHHIAQSVAERGCASFGGKTEDVPLASFVQQLRSFCREVIPLRKESGKCQPDHRVESSKPQKTMNVETDDLAKNWRADVYKAARRIMGSTHSAPMLVVDKDGTLTNPRKLLSPDVAEVVLDLLSVGVVMAVITGGEFYRLRSEVFDPLEKVAKDWKIFDNLYLISENGAQTCRFRASRNDFERVHRVDLKDKIGEKNFRVILGLVSELMEKHNIERIPERKQVVSGGSQIKFSPLGNVQDDKLRASFDPTGERRKLWAEYLKRRMTDNGLLDQDGLIVDVIVAGTGSINILPRGVNKGSAIRRLARLCGLSNAATMYLGDKFGDDGNDADAIVHVGVSVNVGADIDALSSAGPLINCSEKGPTGARICLETVARVVRDFGLCGASLDSARPEKA